MFADTNRPTSTFQTKPKVKFLDTSTGKATFRILDTSATKFTTHFLNRTTVQCLGDGCPICANNRTIIARDSKDFRKDPAYSPAATRFAVNVLDKSNVRTCPSCGLENPATVSICKSCNTFIGNEPPHISGTVKVLTKGVQLFDQLNSLNDAVLNAKGDKIGINGFDLNLIISGTGRSTNYTTIPSISPQVMDGSVENDMDFSAYTLYDLTDAVLKLSADELLDLRKGVSVRDILVARGKTDTDLVKEELEDTSEDVRKQLEELLKE